MHRTPLAVTLVLLASAGQASGGRPNQRMKLSASGGRSVGNGFVLIAAAAGRSLCAIRYPD